MFPSTLNVLLFGSTFPISWRHSRSGIAYSSLGLEFFHLLFCLHCLQSLVPKCHHSSYDWVRDWGARSVRGNSDCLMHMPGTALLAHVGVTCQKRAFLGSWEREAALSWGSRSHGLGWASWKAIAHSLGPCCLALLVGNATNLTVSTS